MQNGNVIIRPVEQIDACQLRQNCFPMNTLEEMESLIAANIRAFAEDTTVMLVAETDGKIVGSITLQRRLHRLCKHRAEVGGLVIHSPYQGRGIARWLIE